MMSSSNLALVKLQIIYYKAKKKDNTNTKFYNSAIMSRGSEEFSTTNIPTSIEGNGHLNYQGASATLQTAGNMSYNSFTSRRTTDGQPEIPQTQPVGQILDQNFRSQPWSQQGIDHTNRVILTEQTYLVPSHQQVTGTQANNIAQGQRVQTQRQSQVFAPTSNVNVNNPTSLTQYQKPAQTFRVPHGSINNYGQFNDSLTQEQNQFLPSQMYYMYNRTQSQNYYPSNSLSSTNQTYVNTPNQQQPLALAQDFQSQSTSNVQANRMAHYNLANTANARSYHPQLTNHQVQNNVLNQYGQSENIESHHNTPQTISLRNQTAVSGRTNNHGINLNAVPFPDQVSAENNQHVISNNPSHTGQVQQMTNFNPLNTQIQTSPQQPHLRRMLSDPNEFDSTTGMNQMSPSEFQTIANILSNNDEMALQRNNIHHSSLNQSTAIPGVRESGVEPPQVLGQVRNSSGMSENSQITDAEQVRLNIQQQSKDHEPTQTYHYKPISDSVRANDPVLLKSVIKKLVDIFVRLANQPPMNMASNNVSLTSEQMMDFLIKFRDQLKENGLVNGLDTTFTGSFVSGGRGFTEKELIALSEGAIKMEENIDLQQSKDESTDKLNSSLKNSTSQQDDIPARGTTERKMLLREKRNIITKGLGTSMKAYSMLNSLAQKGDEDAQKELREVHKMAYVKRAQKRMLQMETIQIDD